MTEVVIDEYPSTAYNLVIHTTTKKRIEPSALWEPMLLGDVKKESTSFTLLTLNTNTMKLIISLIQFLQQASTADPVTLQERNNESYWDVGDMNKKIQQTTAHSSRVNSGPLVKRRNNPLLSVTPMTRPTKGLDLINNQMGALRSYTTSTGNACGTETQQFQGENTLDQLAKMLLDQNIWPMTNPEYREKAISSILTKQKIVAQRSARIFSDNFNNSNLKRIELLSGTILEEAGQAIASLTWKIVAIEILSNNKGSTTAGVDLKAFKAVPYETETTKQALLSLQGEIKKMKADLSIYKGKTDQAIKRKGIEKLNSREKRRRWLKSGNSDAIDHIRTIKQKYTSYSNPLYSLRTAREQRNDIINHNTSLKLELLNNMKFFKLKHFTADAIRIVNIPKSNGKTRPLGIPTMKDRALQMLLKLTMEPYMEPLGDPHSFGFRPGRGCHQAVSTVANRTTWNRRKGMSRLRMKTFRAGTQLKTSSPTPKFFQTQHLLDADIKGCFDNISHEWLIQNVPMPKGFEHLLPLLLKAPRLQEDNTLQATTGSGIPQGGIISPMLMNWTLDGLESLITTTVANAKVGSHPWVGFFGSSEKKAFMEKNDMLTGLRGRRLTEKIGTRAKVWFVRYADDFILGTNNYEYIPIIREIINAFLKERGLKLSSEKTKEITWKMGAKFDFLSWTFHLVRPKKVNWIVAAPKGRAGRLTDWIGLYVYPSRKSTATLRSKIRAITNITQTSKPIGLIVLELGQLLRGWSNYFFGGKQIRLRRTLDFFIAKRARMFLWKKYGNSKYGTAIERHLKLNGVWAPLHTKAHSDETGIHQIPRLWKQNPEIPWSLLEPNRELVQTSFLVNPIPYIQRKILLDKMKKVKQALLLHKQHEVCPLCNEKLIDENFMIVTEQQHPDADLPTILSLRELALQQSMGPSVLQQRYESSNIAPWISETKWHKGLHVDHIVPRGLGKGNTQLQPILESLDNKQLVHRECHKARKTPIDRKLLQAYKLHIKKAVKYHTDSPGASSNTIHHLVYSEETSHVLRCEAVMKVLNDPILTEYYQTCRTAESFQSIKLQLLGKVKTMPRCIIRKSVKQNSPRSHRLDNLKKVLDRKSLRKRN